MNLYSSFNKKVASALDFEQIIDDEFWVDEMDEEDSSCDLDNSMDDIDIELALRSMDDEQLAKCDAAFEELQKAIRNYEEYEKTLDDDE